MHDIEPNTTNELSGLDAGTCYLNHAAVAPLPIPVATALHRFVEENRRIGASRYPEWQAIEQALRERCRDLLNAASSDDIALVKNTSEALSMVAHGLVWQPGENVVTAREEFPSNRMAWQSLARYGVETRLVSLHGLDDPEQALLDACDANTRLLAVSAVQYASGLKMDLARLGQACREADRLFCVDAIQQLGALPLDVQAIQADFVMADGHKWLLAPEGLAIFWSHADARNALQLHEYGWHMAENLFDFDSLDWQIAASARRFECGSPNMLGIHALHASLGLLLDTGMQRVADGVLANTAWLTDRILADPALELLSDPRQSRRSGIVTFRHRRLDNRVLFAHLKANRVICAERGGGIRFSPHFYTRQADLEQAMWLVADAG